MQTIGEENINDSGKTLSIISVPEGFVFIENNSGKQNTFELKLEALIDFPDIFEKIISEKGLANDSSLPVSIIEHSDRFMLIPSGITDPAKIKTFFGLIHSPKEGQNFETRQLSDGKQTFCYELSAKRTDCFKKNFQDIKIESDAFIIAEWTLKAARQSHTPTIAAFCCKRCMHIFIAKDSELLFANSFKILSLSEATYFLIRCIEQLNLDPEKTNCIIIPTLISGDAFVNSLRPYIRNVNSKKLTEFSEFVFNQ